LDGKIFFKISPGSYIINLTGSPVHRNWPSCTG
jgi:hypothetical protein